MTNQAIRDVYAGLEPAQVWRHFASLNLIPRPSGQEAMASAYVRHVAESHGATWKSDARGNTVVYVPATKGRKVRATVVLQAHLDMVCEKRPEVDIDFTRDPIRPQIVDSPEGKRIYASGTTLGADNGLGAAMALAVLTDSSIEHGPLELLFTVEEETGLFGAGELDGSLFTGKKLINLDTEDPHEIVIGCAGGSGITLTLPLAGETLKSRPCGVAPSRWWLARWAQRHRNQSAARQCHQGFNGGSRPHRRGGYSVSPLAY